MTEIIALGIFALWNIITFAMYGADKGKAKKGRWRVSETALIACAFLMGGVGSFLGMRLFRHKTQHLKFKLLVPLAIIVNICVFVLLFYTGILELPINI
ncbi:MAG: DUF1294 domain-containing protein [Defluviitaleaceae bacterium]|nr:DUF1294 domain-containing protein [Defluviitaleaceae bacterium]